MKYNSKKTIGLITVCSIVIVIAMLVNYRITQHVVERTVIAQQEDIAGKAANTEAFFVGSSSTFSPQ